MKARDIMFGLHEMKGIGWKTIEKLFLRFRPFEKVCEAGRDELQSAGLTPSQADRIVSELNDADVEQKKEKYRRAGVRFITVFDPEYPETLRNSSTPPWVLYGKGNWNLLSAPCIAVVGTRHPTAYGRKVASGLSRELAEHGFCIVSGLARGIDACAHRGALEAEGGTVAVLGTGPDRVYPPENRNLFAEIARKGLIVSEYPIGIPSRPGMFPRRNRVIAALSRGTVVVEAAAKSGSLITADYALEESRDVFAVPGPITSPKSAGTLELIRNGAGMVVSAGDIISEYPHMITVSKKSASEPASELNEDERKVLQHLSSEPVSFDRLLELSQFTFGHLHSVLLSLHMKKRIEPLPGSMYISV